MNEQEILNKFIREGYKIEIKNPNGRGFNEKYAVYQDLGIMGKKYLVLNSEGVIKSRQG